MSKATGQSAAPAIERLSLGSSSSPSTSRPSHALPSLSNPANASASNDGAQTGSSAALVTSEVLDLATPIQHQVDSQALHTLATEMVATLIHSSSFVSRKQAFARQELQLAGIQLPALNKAPSASTAPGPASASTSASSPHSQVVRSISGPDTSSDTLTEIETLLTARLEGIGYHVGYHMTESLARDRAKFTDTLDVLKFICKEVWTAVWGKQVDNLRTNHRGVYVLHDNQFQPLRHVSTAQGAQVTAKQARVFLSYPVGIIKGALAQLDVPSAVVAETNQAPQCTFHVKTQRGGATGASAAAAPGASTPPTAA
ncbi:related to TRS33-subunit of the transport protein particle complex [Sporisorium reilianum f. sp. reilianum]|uniref:Related to TRS33-subunit of the transport protein particle complex n=1 Tax=Sporisorium reilianum f. sp. reilianum TaxID=72559 RepID=A0A2N8UHM6_9BASI|nr:related to TRS33-subunit of the transport protein particle complex [Sporisorium reilianum f. sp. reilianum]